MYGGLFHHKNSDSCDDQEKAGGCDDKGSRVYPGFRGFSLVFPCSGAVRNKIHLVDIVLSVLRKDVLAGAGFFQINRHFGQDRRLRESFRVGTEEPFVVRQIRAKTGKQGPVKFAGGRISVLRPDRAAFPDDTLQIDVRVRDGREKAAVETAVIGVIYVGSGILQRG